MLAKLNYLNGDPNGVISRLLRHRLWRSWVSFESRNWELSKDTRVDKTDALKSSKHDPILIVMVISFCRTMARSAWYSSVTEFEKTRNVHKFIRSDGRNMPQRKTWGEYLLVSCDQLPGETGRTCAQARRGRLSSTLCFITSHIHIVLNSILFHHSQSPLCCSMRRVKWQIYNFIVKTIDQTKIEWDIN